MATPRSRSATKAISACCAAAFSSGAPLHPLPAARLCPPRPPGPPHGRGTGGAPRGHPGPPPAEAEEALPTKPAPGDHVLFLPLGGDQGIIEGILPRRSVLTRARSEAGTQQVMLAN